MIRRTFPFCLSWGRPIRGVWLPIPPSVRAKMRAAAGNEMEHQTALAAKILKCDIETLFELMKGEVA